MVGVGAIEIGELFFGLRYNILKGQPGDFIHIEKHALIEVEDKETII